MLQGQDNRQARASNVGEKSFRCEYEGCGKLYTTAHHLKVIVGCLWLCKHVLLCCFASAYSSVGLFKDNVPLTEFSYDVVIYFLPHRYSLVFVSCRYTSALTLETNHTSATILDVGRSLQQVAEEN